MFIISLSPLSIIYSSPFFYPSSLFPIPTVSGHMPEFPTSIIVSSSVYLHCIGIPSWHSHSLFLLSYHHCICYFNTLYQSKLYCYPLRQHFLPFLPHLRSWQYLSLLLLFRSCSLLLSSFLQPFFLSPTFSLILI